MTDDQQEPDARGDESVLSPDELDITSDENVVEIDDGRYVISPGDGPPNAPDPVESDDADPPTADAPSPASFDLSEDVVHEWLAERVASAESKYAFDVTARFEDVVSQRELFTNDVVATFENLVIWYATNVGSDTPVEDVLGILLMESNLAVRFPADSLAAFAAAHGLGETDDIGSLLDAARAAGGIRFPVQDD